MVFLFPLESHDLISEKEIYYGNETVPKQSIKEFIPDISCCKTDFAYSISEFVSILLPIIDSSFLISKIIPDSILFLL